MKRLTVNGLLVVMCMLAMLLAMGAADNAKPATIKLDDGKQVPIVSVAELNANAADHQGLIAIDGQVAEVWGDKGRFMLAAYGAGLCEDESCEGCAADQQVPIRYDKAKASGVMPKKEQKVYVVATCKTTETGGYTLDVSEIREGTKVLMRVKK